MMDSTSKRSNEKARREKQTKDDLSKVTPDEKLKKSSFTISTPRTFLQKTTTADIYGQKKRTAVQSAKAPKKSPMASHSTTNVSPMNDYLKSSPSSSQVSLRSEKKTTTKKGDTKVLKPTATPRSKIIANVIANSPNVRRKLNMDLEREKSFIKDVPKEPDRHKERSFIKENLKKKVEREKERSSIKEVPKTKNERIKEKSLVKDAEKDKKDKVLSFPNERQRTKTRTLDENEVKILTSEAVDNNVEMLNLSRRLEAKPKAFFIDLDDRKPSQSRKEPLQKPSSDEDVSYEDDFESYESDFDSYHSSPSEHNASDEINDENGDGDENDDESEAVETIKEVKDDEKMLDSGSFDLRDQRSANKLKPALAFIFETAEGIEKPSSLTDEGFQEMSSSSAVSSMRTVHIDVLDRPLFIDFSKSKENRRKKRIGDRLRQRAKDLLSIITLHEMSYSLFEMKPISYDLYMATFGRSNYTQIAVQTFDDGVTEEVQTDEIECEHKWTQHPVEFTKNDICIKEKVESRKYSKNMEDYLTKFTFLTAQTDTQTDVQRNNAINIDENYKTDPLRIFFEQKDGVGPSEMLPYDTYKTKLKNIEYNTQRLGKFLKRIESRISNVLNTNIGNTELSELKVTNMPFSKGYVSISTKFITNENISFLTSTKITMMILSETKSNLIMTVHKDSLNASVMKCTICLWDLSVATREPIKILTAIDNIVVARLRGATDGYFVAALGDGSIHLWDLAEQPTWRDDVTIDDEPTKLVEIDGERLTGVERDREWNKKNSDVGLEKRSIPCLLQSCAFTNSGYNMSSGDATGGIVGLQLVGDPHTGSQDGRRIVGQVVSLQSTGVLTIWSIVQEKSKTIPPDIGKAFWSRMKLEKSQTISIVDHIDIPPKDAQNGVLNNFNLNAAKRRIISRKQERNAMKKKVSRPKSAISFDFDFDRPSSAASGKIKRVLSVEKYDYKNWESGLVCCDLKVMNWMNRDNYLIGRNCGEVLCCRKILGAVKVNKFCVATEASSVTCVEVSPHQLPYFLAATDAGTISVCSIAENRVLLKLDCRNIQPQDVEKYQSDHKGRYVSSVTTRSHLNESGGPKETLVCYQRGGQLIIGWRDGRARPVSVPDGTNPRNLSVTSLSWSHVNPCCLFASLIDGSIVEWELSYSDIYAKCARDAAASACVAGDSTLALLTPEGEVQVHKLSNEQKTKEYLLLFEKYVALL